MIKKCAKLNIIFKDPRWYLLKRVSVVAFCFQGNYRIVWQHFKKLIRIHFINHPDLFLKYCHLFFTIFDLLHEFFNSCLGRL
jgi:hypothetical protein